MTHEELAKIKARLTEATPRPWRWEYGQLVVEGVAECVVVMNEPGINKPKHSDAELIAHAPTDIAALLEEVASLQMRLGLALTNASYLEGLVKRRANEIERLKQSSAAMRMGG